MSCVFVLQILLLHILHTVKMNHLSSPYLRQVITNSFLVKSFLFEFFILKEVIVKPRTYECNYCEKFILSGYDNESVNSRIFTSITSPQTIYDFVFVPCFRLTRFYWLIIRFQQSLRPVRHGLEY